MMASCHQGGGPPHSLAFWQPEPANPGRADWISPRLPGGERFDGRVPPATAWPRTDVPADEDAFCHAMREGSRQSTDDELRGEEKGYGCDRPPHRRSGDSRG